MRDQEDTKSTSSSSSSSSSSSHHEDDAPVQGAEVEERPNSPTLSKDSNEGLVYIPHPSAAESPQQDPEPEPELKGSNEGLEYVPHPSAVNNPPPQEDDAKSTSSSDEGLAYVPHPSAAPVVKEEEELTYVAHPAASASASASAPEQGQTSIAASPTLSTKSASSSGPKFVEHPSSAEAEQVATPRSRDPSPPRETTVRMPEDHDQPDEPDEKVLVDFGIHPVLTTCPHCGRNIKTKVTTDVGLLAWVISIGMCFLGMFLIVCLFLCCVPHFMESFKIREHRCPNCKFLLGKHFGKFSRIL